LAVLVSVTAGFKQPDDSPVVRVLVEFKATADGHELLEFRRLVGAELFKGHFFLLALDIIAFKFARLDHLKSQ